MFKKITAQHLRMGTCAARFILFNNYIVPLFYINIFYWLLIGILNKSLVFWFYSRHDAIVLYLFDSC